MPAPLRMAPRLPKLTLAGAGSPRTRCWGGFRRMLVITDVKCYYCGHVSGQIVGAKNAPLRVSSFVPRPGYTRPLPGVGDRLRCERCQGPVFLEDVSSQDVDGSARRRHVSALPPEPQAA